MRRKTKKSIDGKQGGTDSGAKGGIYQSYNEDACLHCDLHEVKQEVFVKDDTLAPLPLASSSLSTEGFNQISNNSTDLIVYAKRVAGIQTGPDRIYVDGLPTDHVLPVDRIKLISVNANPFSAEYSDADHTRIDIVTRSIARKLRLSSGGVSIGARAPNGIDPHLSSSSHSASIGLTGPIPYLPLAFTTNFDFVAARREEAIIAATPLMQGLSLPANRSATASDKRSSLFAGTDYSTDHLRLNGSVYLGTARSSNLGVSGLTLPEAGLDRQTRARDIRLTFQRTGTGYVYRGGFSAQSRDNTLSSNSGALGITVQGAFVTGGSEISQNEIAQRGWIFKNVVEFGAARARWTAGTTISHATDQQSTVPNPFGHIYFDGLESYTASATRGAKEGVLFVTKGGGQVKYSSYAVTPFIETEVLRRNNLSVIAGLRADYQTAGGVLFSPRVSVVKIMHGFVLKVGGGMFVDTWSNAIFLRIATNDGGHLQQFLVSGVSLTDAETRAMALQSRIVSRISPDLSPTRRWVFKYSVEHPFEHFVPGVEYTYTVGTHLLGSYRLPLPTGWGDILSSDRNLRRHQLHFRSQYNIKGQSVTAHYEWTHSFDNTDGPFSFPARQNDLSAEWARSSGVSPHGVSVVGTFRLPHAVSLSLIGGVRSSSAYDITTGHDAAGNGLFNARDGLTRNSGVGLAYRTLSVYAARRFSIPKFLVPSARNLHMTVGLRGENLLSNRNYTSVNAVSTSPLFGQPLGALPGRSFRLWLNLE